MTMRDETAINKNSTQISELLICAKVVEKN